LTQLKPHLAKTLRAAALAVLPVLVLSLAARDAAAELTYSCPLGFFSEGPYCVPQGPYSYPPYYYPAYPAYPPPYPVYSTYPVYPAYLVPPAVIITPFPFGFGHDGFHGGGHR